MDLNNTQKRKITKTKASDRFSIGSLKNSLCEIEEKSGLKKSKYKSKFLRETQKIILQTNSNEALQSRFMKKLSIRKDHQLEVSKENINVQQKTIPILNNTRLHSADSNVPIVYVSPFVTVSRGKGSAKKENESRTLRGLPPYLKHTTPDKNDSILSISTAYFHKVLDNEISRLSLLCNEWNEYKKKRNVSEDAIDMINVAIGQTNLLINKKFQQFRELIYDCQNQTGEKLVTCKDLQGFWDMVYIQVENLDKRFNGLVKMRSNNWEEIKSDIKEKVVKTKVPVKTANISRLQANIIAQNKSKVKNVLTAVKLTPDQSKTSNNTRKSLLPMLLVTNTVPKSRLSSPGITMMKISHGVKSDGKLNLVLNDQTPKSILKNSSGTEWKTKMTKTVLFKNGEENEEELVPLDTPEVPVKIRRSIRLSKKVTGKL